MARRSINSLSTKVEYVDPDEVAYKEMYGQALNWLAAWLPMQPQNMDLWRSIGSFAIQPPPSACDPGIERDFERIRWVATLTNQLIDNGGRLHSIGYWASDSRPPTLNIKIAVGTVLMRHREADQFMLDLDYFFQVKDLIEMVEMGDHLAIELQEHIMDAEERLRFEWVDIVTKARDFVSDNADA